METKCLFGEHRVRQILYLSRGGSIGGSQRQIGYVIANLERTLYEPIVVCPNHGQFIDMLHTWFAKTHILPLRPWRKFPAALCRYLDAEHLTSLARNEDVALVHCSNLHLNGYALWVAKRLKIPSILHVRTPISTKDVYKHRCHKATAIIAISQRVKRNLLQAGIPPEKITQIDDSVDLNLFRPARYDTNILQHPAAGQGQLRIGIVGRIHPQKKQMEFLKVAQRVVHGSADNVLFFVIGQVRSHAYFDRIRRFVNSNGLAKRVCFMGQRLDMPKVLASFDILVSLSGGSVMFEAMACGKAVISAGFSAQQDAVHIQNGRTGILVSSPHSSALADAMNQLIQTPNLRAQIGRRARIWAEKNLSHIKMAEKTQSLYYRLLR